MVGILKKIKVPVHVNMPLKLLMAIDKEAANRSGFIAKACQSYLDRNDDKVGDASFKQLIIAACNREECPRYLTVLIKAHLDGTL